MKRIINLLTGKVSLPLEFERTLAQYAPTPIQNVVICRKPIQEVFRTVLNVATKGELESKLKGKGYDELYHLYAVLTLNDGTQLQYEKNQRPVLTPYRPTNEEGECIYVERTIGIHLGEFIGNAISRMGKTRYVRYDAIRNNCQDFLLASLEANSLLTKPIADFIKQDVEDLISPQIQKRASLITDVAGVASDIRDIYEQLKTHPGPASSSFLDIFVKDIPTAVVDHLFSKDYFPDVVSLLHKATPSRLAPPQSPEVQNKIEISELPSE